jgi:hypothetical protein
MIGEILAGVSAIGSLLGTIKSAQANRAIEADVSRQKSELQSWYDKEYNQNYLDTDEAKSTIQILRNQMAEQLKKVDQNNAIRGASDEARVATADRLNQRMGSNVTQLAGYGTRYKDSMRREYQGLNQRLNELQLGILQNKSQNWANFGTSAMNFGIGAAEAGGTGAFNEWDNSISNFWKKKKLNKVGGMLNPVSTTNLKVPKLAR